MVRLLVLYGHPTDPATFDKYYEERHIPIAKKMKGLKKWTVGKVQVQPGEERPPFLPRSRPHGLSGFPQRAGQAASTPPPPLPRW